MEIEQFEKIAKEVLVDTGQHSTQLMVERKLVNKIEMNIMVLLYDDDKKEDMLKNLRFLINNGSVDRYFFITEAWMSKDIYTMPSKADDKEEVLVVSEFRRDNRNKILYNKFIRKDNKIVFTERKLLEGKDFQGFSRFNFFLEDVMGEVIKRARIEESLSCVDDNMISEVTKKAREFFNDENITEELMKKTVVNMIKKGRIGFKKKKDLNTICD